MKEWMAWTIVIGILYSIGYLLTSTIVTGVWMHWAMRKAHNVFIRYNLNFAIMRFCPRYYWFMQDYNALYSALYVVFWPVMIPFQYILMTGALKDSLMTKYYY